MWEDLLRVDWGRLTHAYGRANDVPAILTSMVSLDEKIRAEGWRNFYGAVNHQGDFYDSTVAAAAFLVEAVRHSEVPDRASILNYFRERWLDAPEYGGDPLLDEPPTGMDEPTPMLTDAELAAIANQPRDEPDDDGDKDFDLDAYRNMDLCAWQTGRAIQAGTPAFETLLEDEDREVAAAAAALLLLWPETRIAGKAALVRTIEAEPSPVKQGRRILELGVYARAEDAARFEEWVAPDRPAAMRAAAALAWAWAVNPAALPAPAAEALDDTSVVDSRALANLPWVGVFRRGPWILPANSAHLILRLADNNDDELRWRAVQGLEVGHETAMHLSSAQVVPVLVKRLSDRYDRVREAAALALSQRGEAVLEFDADVVPALLHALGDTAPTVCGHAARLLATLSHRLTPAQRKEAVASVDRAARRFSDKVGDYVSFRSMSIQASPFLYTQRGRIQESVQWDVTELLAEFAFPDKEDRRLSPLECDRRLADAYARDPRGTLTSAVNGVSDSSNRAAAVGAALWLMTLGPAAETALRALDAMAAGKLDPYAQAQARDAGEFIRKSLLVKPDMESEFTSGPEDRSQQKRIALLVRDLTEHSLAGSDVAALVPELVGYLEAPDVSVRAGSAHLFALLTPTTPHISDAIPSLEKLLADEASTEVGVNGAFELEGRLYYWRRERRCPRAAALRALFRLGHIPPGDRMLAAMLAESTHAAITCGRCVAPHRYTIAQWSVAVDTAGGLSVADPIIRAARRQCRERAWSENNADGSAVVAEAELAWVLRRLSGRLV